MILGLILLILKSSDVRLESCFHLWVERFSPGFYNVVWRLRGRLRCGLDGAINYVYGELGSFGCWPFCLKTAVAKVFVGFFCCEPKSKRPRSFRFLRAVWGWIVSVAFPPAAGLVFSFIVVNIFHYVHFVSIYR